MLDIFDSLSPGKARSFVAITINWLLLIYSFEGFSDEESTDEESTYPSIDYQTLVSIYREVPPGSVIPLFVIVNLIGDSIQRVAEFFQAFKYKNFELHAQSTSRNPGEERVTMLRRAYMGLDEGAVLLPILGELAENGSLAGQHIDIRNRNP